MRLRGALHPCAVVWQSHVPPEASEARARLPVEKLVLPDRGRHLAGADGPDDHDVPAPFHPAPAQRRQRRPSPSSRVLVERVQRAQPKFFREAMQ